MVQALTIHNNNDGSHTITGTSIDQTINSIFNDTTTGGGGADLFAYTPFFGQATITDYGNDDKISLPTSEFVDYAYVQAHSSVQSGNLVLTAQSSGDKLILNGVTTLPTSDHILFA